MHNLSLALDGAWRVLVAGLLLGAGLPMLFAFGIRALSLGAGRAAQGATAPASSRPADTAHPIGKLVGGTCFAVVVVGIALGIAFIVASGFGKTLSFEHVYPTVVAKQ